MLRGHGNRGSARQQQLTATARCARANARARPVGQMDGSRLRHAQALRVRARVMSAQTLAAQARPPLRAMANVVVNLFTPAKNNAALQD
jgi:hypothetical protein